MAKHFAFIKARIAQHGDWAHVPVRLQSLAYGLLEDYTHSAFDAQRGTEWTSVPVDGAKPCDAVAELDKKGVYPPLNAALAKLADSSTLIVEVCSDKTCRPSNGSSHICARAAFKRFDPRSGKPDQPFLITATFSIEGREYELIGHLWIVITLLEQRAKTP